MKLILTILPIVISMIALFISLINYLNSRPKLKVQLSRLDTVERLFLDDGQSITNDFGIIRINLTFINPSNIDIGIFQLAIVDDKGNIYDYLRSEQINKLVGAQLNAPLSEQKIISALQTNGEHIFVNVPSNSFELIPAHSFATTDLIVMDTRQIDSGMIMGKIAIKQDWLYRLTNKVTLGYFEEKEFQKFAFEFLAKEKSQSPSDNLN